MKLSELKHSLNRSIFIRGPVDYISSVKFYRISGATVPQELTSCCCYGICWVLLINSLLLEMS